MCPQPDPIHSHLFLRCLLSRRVLIDRYLIPVAVPLEDNVPASAELVDSEKYLVPGEFRKIP
jgi:hypothetical protein